MRTDVCRVSVHLDGRQTDIALPADITVGQLIPSLFELLAGTTTFTQQPPTCLHRPGLPPLDPAMTLSEAGIPDGSLLLLGWTAVDPAPVPVVYAADAVEQLAHPQHPSPQRARLAALLVVVALATVVGFVAVPDVVGAPNLLLGAAAAAGTAAISARACRYGRTALTAVSLFSTLVAVTTLAATLFDTPGPNAGLLLAVVSVCLLAVPGRLPVLLSGLSRHVEEDLAPESDGVPGEVWTRARRARNLLTSLVVGASLAAGFGIAARLFATDAGWLAFAVAGLVAAVLLLRSRSHTEPIRRAVLLGAGTFCLAVLLVSLRLHEPGLSWWICLVSAGVAAVAIWLGFDPPAAAESAAVRRCLDLVECAALSCVIPMACWDAGVFGAVRGLNL
ncbi:MAG: type VII secretion integral membrane protein EccD [Mycobacterium sp.]